MSAADIRPGARWGAEVMQQLRGSNFGIVCVTRECANAPWLIFEVGALAQAFERAAICPYLIDLDPAELSGPLVMFQAIRAEREPTWILVRSIYQRIPEQDRRLSEQQLRVVFDRFWPDLQRALEQIPTDVVNPAPARSDRALLQEVLETVRGLTRVTGQLLSTWGDEKETRVNIDVSGATGHEQIANYTWNSDQVTLQTLLNRLWSDYLKERIPPFTYGETWHLVDATTDRVLKKPHLADRRLLQEFGIEEDKLLRLVVLK